MNEERKKIPDPSEQDKDRKLNQHIRNKEKGI